MNIVRVVGEYVALRQVSTRWIGLCPFHAQTTPSFNVNERLQIYKCFGCGFSGDAVKFVMEKEGLSFADALRLLTERFT